jgi:hypothetical protein
MNYSEFIASLNKQEPPQGISPILSALWYDGKGNWEASHNVAQDIHNTDGSWVHAYLHRKEGDLSNARYWYAMAGKPESKLSLKDEWHELVKSFCDSAK